MSNYGLLKKHIYNASMEDRASSFCKCTEVQRHSNDSINTTLQYQLTCECGEDASDDLEWNWDTDNAIPHTQFNGKLVVFHPFYSQGTSVIRGNKVLNRNMHHYWEIKIISSLSGTDFVSRLLYHDIINNGSYFYFIVSYIHIPSINLSIYILCFFLIVIVPLHKRFFLLYLKLLEYFILN